MTPELRVHVSCFARRHIATCFLAVAVFSAGVLGTTHGTVPVLLSDCVFTRTSKVLQSCDAESSPVTPRLAVASLLHACIDDSADPRAQRRPLRFLAPENSLVQTLTQLGDQTFVQTTGIEVDFVLVPRIEYFSNRKRYLLDPDPPNATNGYDILLATATAFGDAAQVPGKLPDLSYLIAGDPDMAWNEIPTQLRAVGATYDGSVRAVPVNYAPFMLLYNLEVFEREGLQVPQTWEEMADLAERYHNRDTMLGACVMPVDCRAESLILRAIFGSYVQTLGASHGVFWDTETLEPLVKTPAMEEALKVFRRLARLLNTTSDRPVCFQSLLIEGRCLMTIADGYLFKMSNLGPPGYRSVRGKMGFALMPGSTRVLDRRTKRLVTCTDKVCPLAQGKTAQGIPVNRPIAMSTSILLVNGLSPLQYQFFAYQLAARMASPGVIGTNGFLMDINELLAVREDDTNLRNVPTWVARGYDEGDVTRYLTACRRVYENANLNADLRIRLTSTVTDALVVAGVSYNNVSGNASLAQTMDYLESVLNGIVATEGREVFAAQYRRSLNWGPASPAPPQAAFGDTGGSPAPSKPKKSVIIVVTCGVVVLVSLVVTAVLLVRRRRRLTAARGASLVLTAPGVGPGTTLCITDIQDSTTLWEELNEVMNVVLDVHHDIVRRLLVVHRGYECLTEGDSFIVAFHSVSTAVLFCLEMQQALLDASWPKELLRYESSICGCLGESPTEEVVVMEQAIPLGSSHPRNRNKRALHKHQQLQLLQQQQQQQQRALQTLQHQQQEPNQEHTQLQLRPPPNQLNSQWTVVCNPDAYEAGRRPASTGDNAIAGGTASAADATAATAAVAGVGMSSAARSTATPIISGLPPRFDPQSGRFNGAAISALMETRPSVALGEGGEAPRSALVATVLEHEPATLAEYLTPPPHPPHPSHPHPQQQQQQVQLLQQLSSEAGGAGALTGLTGGTSGGVSCGSHPSGILPATPPPPSASPLLLLRFQSPPTTGHVSFTNNPVFESDIAQVVGSGRTPRSSSAVVQPSAALATALSTSPARWAPSGPDSAQGQSTSGCGAASGAFVALGRRVLTTRPNSARGLPATPSAFAVFATLQPPPRVSTHNLPGTSVTSTGFCEAPERPCSGRFTTLAGWSTTSGKASTLASSVSGLARLFGLKREVPRGDSCTSRPQMAAFPSPVPGADAGEPSELMPVRDSTVPPDDALEPSDVEKGGPAVSSGGGGGGGPGGYASVGAAAGGAVSGGPTAVGGGGGSGFRRALRSRVRLRPQAMGSVLAVEADGALAFQMLQGGEARSLSVPALKRQASLLATGTGIARRGAEGSPPERGFTRPSFSGPSPTYDHPGALVLQNPYGPLHGQRTPSRLSGQRNRVGKAPSLSSLTEAVRGRSDLGRLRLEWKRNGGASKLISMSSTGTDASGFLVGGSGPGMAPPSMAASAAATAAAPVMSTLDVVLRSQWRTLTATQRAMKVWELVNTGGGGGAVEGNRVTPCSSTTSMAAGTDVVSVLGSELRMTSLTTAGAAGTVVFRGLRVRAGLSCGVGSETEIVRDARNGRVQYSGRCMRLAKLVSDAAHGGMVLLSDSARAVLEQELAEGGGPGAGLMRRWQPVMVWMGRHSLAHDLEDAHLFQVTSSALVARLALLQRPLRTLAMQRPLCGALAAPVGVAAAARLTVPWVPTLMAWNAAVTCHALDTVYGAFLDELRKAPGRPYVVEGALGLHNEAAAVVPTAGPNSSLLQLGSPGPASGRGGSLTAATATVAATVTAAAAAADAAHPLQAPRTSLNLELNSQGSVLLSQLHAGAVNANTGSSGSKQRAAPGRGLKDGASGGPRPGVMTVVFESAEAAAVWLLRCIQVLPTLPWPMELLEHPLCEPLDLDTLAAVVVGGKEGPPAAGAHSTAAAVSSPGRKLPKRRESMRSSLSSVNNHLRRPVTLSGSRMRAPSDSVSIPSSDLFASGRGPPAAATLTGSSGGGGPAAAAPPPHPTSAVVVVVEEEEEEEVRPVGDPPESPGGPLHSQCPPVGAVVALTAPIPAPAAPPTALASLVTGNKSGGWGAKGPPDFAGLRASGALSYGELGGQLPPVGSLVGQVVYKGKAWQALVKMSAKAKLGQVCTDAATLAHLRPDVAAMMAVMKSTNEQNGK